MHFLFVAQGTAGDSFPQLALAKELHRLGQRVSFLTHTHFGDLIRRCGLAFIDLEDEQHYGLLHGPDYWDPARALPKQVEFLTAHIRKQYELVVQHYEP